MQDFFSPKCLGVRAGGSGKTALCKHFAQDSNASFLRVVEASDIAHLHEYVIAEHLYEAVKEATDATSTGIVLIDDLDILLGFTERDGGKVLNPAVLRTFCSLTRRPPVHTHGLLFITTFRSDTLCSLLEEQGFYRSVRVPGLEELVADEDMRDALQQAVRTVGGEEKAVEEWMAKEERRKLSLQHFLEFSQTK